MEIIDYKGFKLRKPENVLILTSSAYQSAKDIMKKQGITSLEINPNFIKVKSIEFLSEFDFIEGFNLLSKVSDISPVNHLNNLKELSIECSYVGLIDFEQFQKLDKCYFIWSGDGSESVFRSRSITALRIDGFSKVEPLPFIPMGQLKSLSLYHSKLTNLLGLKSLQNLKKLDLTDASQLEDISELAQMENLEELRLDYCRNIKSFEPIGSLKKLKVLALNNIGDIHNLDFTSHLTNLEQIIFSENTNVKSGNLNVLIALHKSFKLKEAIFKPRRHYTHKPADIGFKAPDVVANIFKKR